MFLSSGLFQSNQPCLFNAQEREGIFFISKNSWLQTFDAHYVLWSRLTKAVRVGRETSWLEFPGDAQPWKAVSISLVPWSSFLALNAVIHSPPTPVQSSSFLFHRLSQIDNMGTCPGALLYFCLFGGWPGFFPKCDCVMKLKMSVLWNTANILPYQPVFVLCLQVSAFEFSYTVKLTSFELGPNLCYLSFYSF